MRMRALMAGIKTLLNRNEEMIESKERFGDLVRFFFRKKITRG